jgi:GNAT superfamily N-acetyltransferase
MTMSVQWRGEFTNTEVNRLHAEAFTTRMYGDDEWDWVTLTARHSLGWVVGRRDGALVGFVNVLWDGLAHAWIQDTMVSESARHTGVGTALVAAAVTGATEAGCDWLHVDFDAGLEEFYLRSCGFTPARAGLLALRR